MEFVKRRLLYILAIGLGCAVLCIGAAVRVIEPKLWYGNADADETTALTAETVFETEETESVTAAETEPVTADRAETEPIETESTVTEPIVTEPIVTEPIVTEPVTVEPIETATPVTQPSEPEVIPTYDASDAVAASPAVGAEYFDDALFIGNSLMKVFSHAVSDQIGGTHFVTIGLSVQTFFTKPFIPGGGDTLLTASEALETVEFSKVYLMFGANELAWPSPEGWAGIYGSIIDRIHEVNPDAVIYVQSVLPICHDKYIQSSEYQEGVTNEAAVRFNELLLLVCRDRGAHFVNVAEAVRTEEGGLIPEATNDGLHLNYTYCLHWLDYLKTHTVQ